MFDHGSPSASPKQETVVLKLNGGLGTSMGLDKAWSTGLFFLKILAVV